MTNTKHNIVCGIDNNYVEHLVTTLNSLFVNNEVLRFHIFIFSLGIHNQNKQAIKAWVEDRNHEVTFIDIVQNQLSEFPIFDEGYISPATYLRLFIPSLLPQSVDKVLYLDSDIIVNTNIEELLNTDISNNTLAAVEDAPNNSVILRNKNQPYFNAGVLLLNLKELRKKDFLSEAMTFIKENNARLYFHDQDVLNALLGDRAKILPIKWNMLDCFYDIPPRIHAKYQHLLKITSKKKCIIHFSGKIKPWHKASLHPLTRIYYKFKPKSKYLPSNNMEKWQHFNEIPRYRKAFVYLHFPIWLQRILDYQICWSWRKLKP